MLSSTSFLFTFHVLLVVSIDPLTLYAGFHPVLLFSSPILLLKFLTLPKCFCFNHYSVFYCVHVAHLFPLAFYNAYVLYKWPFLFCLVSLYITFNLFLRKPSSNLSIQSWNPCPRSVVKRKKNLFLFFSIDLLGLLFIQVHLSLGSRLLWQWQTL